MHVDIAALRSETRWKNRPTNKTAGGLSASYVGGVVALGAKVEDRCACLLSHCLLSSLLSLGGR